MPSEAPLTLILSPLRAWRGELERTCLGSLFGDPDTVPPKVPLSLRKRERVRVRVRLDCKDTAKSTEPTARAPSAAPAAGAPPPTSPPSRALPGRGRRTGPRPHRRGFGDSGGRRRLARGP